MKKIVALVLTLVLALSLATVAFADATPVLANQWTKTTDVTAATATNVSVYFTKAAAPTTNDDGDTVKEGHVAYYTIGSTNYVAVATKAEADLIVASDAEYKNVTLYLDAVNPFYLDAKVVTDFGKKCGQIKFADYDSTKTYYVAEWQGNDRLYVANTTTPDASLMVAGKLVSAKFVGALELVAHVQTPVVADGKLTGYKCANCGVAAIKAPNYASVPTGITPFLGSDGEYYYFAASAVATAATTGVSSAKTFDAGVALYAGMALMSVAGSAVVIGKKKEF